MGAEAAGGWCARKVIAAGAVDEAAAAEVPVRVRVGGREALRMSSALDYWLASRGRRPRHSGGGGLAGGEQGGGAAAERRDRTFDWAG